MRGIFEKMRLLITLGGNALLKRGEVMKHEIQRAKVRFACSQIAKTHEGKQLIVTATVRRSVSWLCRTTPARCSRST